MDNRTPLTAAGRDWLNDVQVRGSMRDRQDARDRIRAIEAEAADREREAVAGLRASQRETIARTLHDLIDTAYDDGCDHSREIMRPWQCRAWADAILATEAATRDASPEPLDVERLARAITSLRAEDPDFIGGLSGDSTAALIAAEYLRLKEHTDG